MKTIIAGSRDIEDYELLCQAIKDSKYTITEVISGTARGVDRLGERWAKENNIPVRRMPADWSIGKQAGYLRNVEMAKVAEACIVLTNGSRGAGHMINIAKEKGIPTYVRRIE